MAITFLSCCTGKDMGGEGNALRMDLSGHLFYCEKRYLSGPFGSPNPARIKTDFLGRVIETDFFTSGPHTGEIRAVCLDTGEKYFRIRVDERTSYWDKEEGTEFIPRKYVEIQFYFKPHELIFSST